MKETENNYCVILAGGKGRRLWPCSREERPKQFVDFFGTGRTALQQTYDRFARILPPENIFVNTNEEYADLVREQLPQLDASRMLAEPIHRGTAPSMAWATHRIIHINPEANIIAVDYDPGASEVNQQNRIKLMLATAAVREKEKKRQAQKKG